MFLKGLKLPGQNEVFSIIVGRGQVAKLECIQQFRLLLEIKGLSGRKCTWTHLEGTSLSPSTSPKRARESCCTVRCTVRGKGKSKDRKRV